MPSDPPEAPGPDQPDVPASDQPDVPASDQPDIAAADAASTGTPAESTPRHRHRAPRKQHPHPRRRIVVWSLASVVTLILLATAWLGWQVWQARGHLLRAASMVGELQQDLSDGDAASAADVLSDLQDETAGARANAHDVMWSAAQSLPRIGANLRVIRLIADSVDDLASQTLPPLVNVASSLDPKALAPANGVINVEALTKAAPAVVDADRAIADVQARLADVDTAPLFGPVKEALTEFRSELRDAKQLTATAARAAQLLPPMLGSDGRRTYLLVFQNLAEARATGGIFGAYAVVTADHGTITLQKQGATSTDIKKFDPPIVALPEHQTAIYGDKPAQWPMDVNMMPDFPQAADLFAKMYTKTFGTRVDGVIATDPVALSKILKATGPIDLSDTVANLSGVPSLDSANAVTFLLSDAYAIGTPQQADAVFKASAKAVFTALLSGQGDPKGVLDALVDASRHHRVLIWSAHPDEQRLLAGTVLDGALPDDASGVPTVGVFFNDATGAKLDYYLRRDLDVVSTRCRPDGSLDIAMTLTMSSTSPASGLPDYVIGLAAAGPYVMRTNVLLFSPIGGASTDVTLGTQPVRVRQLHDFDRAVGKFTVELDPGASQTYQITVTTAPLPEPTDSIRVEMTPLAAGGPAVIDVPLDGASTRCAAGP